jgi:multidrug efflux system outer membrane protein
MKFKLIYRNTGLFVILLLLIHFGCRVGPDYVTPTVYSPEKYRSDFPSDTTIANIPWWELFGDTVLQRLITTALENNNNLRAAVARIDEARASMDITRADLYPRIDYSIDGAAVGITTEGASYASLTPLASVSYEVDLWGRIHRLTESALQQYFATEEAYRSITIALVASVANAYLQLRDIDNRLLISENTAKTWRDNLDIMQARYDAGICSEVELNQARIQLDDALASIEANHRLRTQTENAISILLGLPPQDIPRGLNLQEQILPPELPAGLPSDILNRRPDIMQAENQLHAQSERIGAAEALKYPQLILSANLGAQITNPSAAFTSLGAQLLGPLLNAKANRRRVDVEIARTEQLLNNYEETYIVALQEVEDAMVAVERYRNEYQIRQNQVEAAESAVDLSWVRYENGVTNYLEILDLQRSSFSSQLQASQALQLQLTSTINLYKALGGGWVPGQDTVYLRELTSNTN